MPQTKAGMLQHVEDAQGFKIEDAVGWHGGWRATVVSSLTIGKPETKSSEAGITESSDCGVSWTPGDRADQEKRQQNLEFLYGPHEVTAYSIVDPDRLSVVHLSIHFQVEIVQAQSEERVDIECPVEPASEGLPVLEMEVCSLSIDPEMQFGN